MGKNKTKKTNTKDLRGQHKKIERQYNSGSFSLSSIIKVVLVILLVLLIFYFLTVGILNKKSKTSVSNNASIQYREILAGESFDLSDNEYYVFYYDSTSANADEEYALVTNYNEKNKKVFMYTVDLSEGLNRDYRSDVSNSNATNASELKISGTTLVHFKDGKIVEYITDNISEYLNK